MKSNLIILVLLIIPFCLCAQMKPHSNEVGASLNLGISKIVGSTDNYYRPSALIGLYHKYKLSNKTYIGMEFLLSQIEGKQKYDDAYLTDTSEYYHYFSHSTYAGFAFIIGWDIFKFSIDLKPQVNMIIVNRGSMKGYANTDLVIEEKYNDFLSTKYDFGLRASINYQFLKNFSVSASYYQGINSVHSYEGPQMHGHIIQILMGIKYTLVTSD